MFWEGAADRRLVVQQCAECETLRHPPTPMCARCGSVAVVAYTCSGRGRIYSWMLSHHPNLPDEPPRVVVLVELEEGLRVVSNLLDPPGAGPYEDLEVEVDFVEVDDAILPIFRAVACAEAARS